MNPPHLALDDKLDLEAVLKYVDTTFLLSFLSHGGIMQTRLCIYTLMIQLQIS